MNQPKILVVDDEPNILILLRDSLIKEKFSVWTAKNPAEATKIIEKEKIEMLVLDLELGAESGLDFCKKLKKREATKNIAIIMITAKFIDTDNIVKGLDIGADDYVTKPFKVNILIARINAILRRKGLFTEQKLTTSNTKYFKVDEPTKSISLNNNMLILTPKEYKILALMISKQNIVIEKGLLMKEIWGDDYYGTFRTLDKHVENIRKKLGIYSDSIETISGIGYKFSEKI
ncbi:MAG: response regulator transcription factor [Elusimicrobiota bacterium]|jgi:DNA-binding response OmpR family regulator|nr:response regulator transcription factor [Elusimicrobiota bacterium]